MSAPNESAAEDLRNALQLLYGLEVTPLRKGQLSAVQDSRKRILAALRKLETQSSAAAT